MLPVSLSRTAVHLARGSESRAIRRRMDRCCQALGTPVNWTEHGLEVALGMPATDFCADPAPPCRVLACDVPG
jgi:hypothetical protein